jgi:hypothetical protein
MKLAQEDWRILETLARGTPPFADTIAPQRRRRRLEDLSLKGLVVHTPNYFRPWVLTPLGREAIDAWLTNGGTLPHDWKGVWRCP